MVPVRDWRLRWAQAGTCATHSSPVSSSSEQALQLYKKHMLQIFLHACASNRTHAGKLMPAHASDAAKVQRLHKGLLLSSIEASSSLSLCPLSALLQYS